MSDISKIKDILKGASTSSTKKKAAKKKTTKKATNKTTTKKTYTKKKDKKYEKKERPPQKELDPNAPKVEVVGYGMIDGAIAPTTFVKKTKNNIVLRYNKTSIDLSFPITDGKAATLGQNGGWMIPEDKLKELLENTIAESTPKKKED